MKGRPTVDAQAEARTVLEWLHYQAAKSFPHTAGDCELCEAWETVDSTLCALAARLEAAETALRDLINETEGGCEVADCDYPHCECSRVRALRLARAALAAGRGEHG